MDQLLLDVPKAKPSIPKPKSRFAPKEEQKEFKITDTNLSKKEEPELPKKKPKITPRPFLRPKRV
jgi:hypothetical protein